MEFLLCLWRDIWPLFIKRPMLSVSDEGNEVVRFWDRIVSLATVYQPGNVFLLNDVAFQVSAEQSQIKLDKKGKPQISPTHRE